MHYDGKFLSVREQICYFLPFYMNRAHDENSDIAAWNINRRLLDILSKSARPRSVLCAYMLLRLIDIFLGVVIRAYIYRFLLSMMSVESIVLEGCVHGIITSVRESHDIGLILCRYI